MRKFYFLIFLLTLFFPLNSLAGTYTANGYTVTYDGLVPCGRCLKVDPAVPADKLTAEYCGVKLGVLSNKKYISCHFCHFFVMFKEILDFVLWKLVFPLAVLLIVIGGMMFLFAGEDPKWIATATNLFKSVIISLLIIFSAWLLINLFFMVIGVADWTGLKKWWEINCPIKI